MAKFNNSRDSGERGRSDRGKGERQGRAEGSKGEDKKKKDGYKAKRSFSKNKIFREIQETRGDRKSRPSGEGRKNFRPPFKRDDKRTERPGKEPSKFGTNSERFAKGGEREKPFRERREERSEAADRPSYRDREERSDRKTSPKKYKKPVGKDDKFGGFKKANSEFPAREGSKSEKKPRFKKPRKSDEAEGSRRVNYEDFEEGKAFSKNETREKKSAPGPSKGKDDLIRLNKYLSNAGVASRRDADNLILSGVVKVNGVVVDQLGYKIKPGDKVTYGDAAVKAERKVYLLLNKPKDYITTVDDPRERKTVMELIAGACRERIYPVGRLDRNTTGLLLFTNDGELTNKLTHPKFGVKKVYHVSLNKGLKPDDFKAITEGVELEDGFVKADDLAFVGEGKKEVGIEIHSGRNRIVRRLFEHLGYDVIKLDRVVFAGLTKKDLPRGKHRFLTAKEISFLQMIG